MHQKYQRLDRTPDKLFFKSQVICTIASHIAQANWRPAEDVGNHGQGRPGDPLWLRMVEKGLGESL